MKTLLISILFSISAWADGQLCYQPDSTQPDQICIPVSADVQTAISNYVAAPANQNTVPNTTKDGINVSIIVPKYLGVGDAIFQNINLFFQGALANFPPDSVQQAAQAKPKPPTLEYLQAQDRKSVV